MTAFHIRPYEHYCTEEILPLYEAVGWTNYTQRPDMLRDAFAGPGMCWRPTTAHSWWEFYAL